MSTVGIILSFVGIALIRIMQRLCNKETSKMTDTSVKSYTFVAIQQGFAALLAFICLFFVGFYGFDKETIICSLVTGVLFAIEIWSSIEVLKNADIAVASIFAFGGIIISVIASHLFFNEPASYVQIIGLVLFLISAFMLVWSKSEQGKRINIKTIMLLIISLLSNGFITVAQKYFSLRIANGNTYTYSFLSFIVSSIVTGLIALIILLIRYSKHKNELSNNLENKIINKKTFIFAPILAGCIFGLNVLITEMGRTLSGVILFPVSCAIGVFVSSIIGFVIYKEKITVVKIIGIILGLISIAIIGVFSVDFLSTL